MDCGQYLMILSMTISLNTRRAAVPVRLSRLYAFVHAEWAIENTSTTAHGRTSLHLLAAQLRDAVHPCESPLSRPRAQPAEARRQLCGDHDARTERRGVAMAGEVSRGTRRSGHNADQEDATAEPSLER